MPIEVFRAANFDPNALSRTVSLHNHTTGSDGRASYKQIIELGIQLGVDIIAITDHDKVKTSLEARNWARRNRFPVEIVTGSEITTRGNAHLLALGIEHDIPPFLSLSESLNLIHKQGGIGIATHPFYRRLQGGHLGRSRMDYLTRITDPQDRIDGVEIFNGGIAARGSLANDEAMLFYLAHEDHLGAAIGASDTHNLEMAMVLTAVQGADIYDAIRKRQTAVIRQSRQERLHGITHAVLLMREGIFQGAPTLTRRLARRDVNIQAFVSEQTPSSELTALEVLSYSELARFRQLSETRRPAFLASREALKRAYCAITGQDRESMRFFEVDHNIFDGRTSGPPYIINGEDFYYSLSHSGNIGMGSVADIPTGVDVQKIMYGRTAGLRALRDDEITEEAQNGDLSLEEIIAKLWSRNEAIAKGLQTGISRDLAFRSNRLSDNEFTVEPVYHEVALPVWRTRTVERNGYFLTVAAQTTKNIDLGLRWV